MSPRSGSEDIPREPGSEPFGRLVDSAAVPRQLQRTAREADVAAEPTAVSGDAAVPDPATEADAAATENLLRCWVREHDLPRPAEDSLRLSLDATGIVLRVPVRHWSATGWHRFGPPRPYKGGGAPVEAAPLDAVTLAALLGREAASRSRAGAGGAG
ncbi:MAG: iron transporter, partial [Streptomyces sp.]